MKLLALFFVAIAMSACQLAQPKPVSIPTFVKYDCGTPPAVEKFVPLEVEWKLLPGPDGYMLFTLTAQQYEALSKDMADILARTKELKLQRDFYKTCIDRSGEPQ